MPKIGDLVELRGNGYLYPVRRAEYARVPLRLQGRILAAEDVTYEDVNERKILSTNGLKHSKVLLVGYLSGTNPGHLFDTAWIVVLWDENLWCTQGYNIVKSGDLSVVGWHYGGGGGNDSK